VTQTATHDDKYFHWCHYIHVDQNYTSVFTKNNERFNQLLISVKRKLTINAAVQNNNTKTILIKMSVQWAAKHYSS